MGYQERKRESERVYTRSCANGMDFFDGLCEWHDRAILPACVTKQSSHVTSHNVSICCELPADRRQSIDLCISHTTQKKSSYTHARHTGSHSRCEYAKIENGCTRDPHFDCYCCCCCFSVASRLLRDPRFLDAAERFWPRRLLNKKMGFLARIL